MSRAPLDPKYRAVRCAYGAFYLLALPLFLFVLLCLLLTWLTWPNRGNGVMEGPEPTDAEVISACVAGGAFAIGYVAVWLLVSFTRFSGHPGGREKVVFS